MLNHFFPKSNRLLRSRDFRLCAQQGEEKAGRFLFVQIRKASTPERKLGLIVSRRFGNAVHRNRLKRLTREAFRLSQHTLPSHIHIAVRPRSAALTATFAQIQEELIHLILTTD